MNKKSLIKTGKTVTSSPRYALPAIEIQKFAMCSDNSNIPNSGVESFPYVGIEDELFDEQSSTKEIVIKSKETLSSGEKFNSECDSLDEPKSYGNDCLNLNQKVEDINKQLADLEKDIQLNFYDNQLYKLHNPSAVSVNKSEVSTHRSGENKSVNITTVPPKVSDIIYKDDLSVELRNEIMQYRQTLKEKVKGERMEKKLEELYKENESTARAKSDVLKWVSTVPPPSLPFPCVPEIVLSARLHHDDKELGKEREIVGEVDSLKNTTSKQTLVSNAVSKELELDLKNLSSDNSTPEENSRNEEIPNKSSVLVSVKDLETVGKVLQKSEVELKKMKNDVEEYFDFLDKAIPPLKQYSPISEPDLQNSSCMLHNTRRSSSKESSKDSFNSPKSCQIKHTYRSSDSKASSKTSVDTKKSSKYKTNSRVSTKSSLLSGKSNTNSKKPPSKLSTSKKLKKVDNTPKITTTLPAINEYYSNASTSSENKQKSFQPCPCYPNVETIYKITNFDDTFCIEPPRRKKSKLTQSSKIEVSIEPQITQEQPEEQEIITEQSSSSTDKDVEAIKSIFRKIKNVPDSPNKNEKLPEVEKDEIIVTEEKLKVQILPKVCIRRPLVKQIIPNIIINPEEAQYEVPTQHFENIKYEEIISVNDPPLAINKPILNEASIEPKIVSEQNIEAVEKTEIVEENETDSVQMEISETIVSELEYKTELPKKTIAEELNINIENLPSIRTLNKIQTYLEQRCSLIKKRMSEESVLKPDHLSLRLQLKEPPKWSSALSSQKLEPSPGPSSVQPQKIHPKLELKKNKIHVDKIEPIPGPSSVQPQKIHPKLELKTNKIHIDKIEPIPGPSGLQKIKNKSSNKENINNVDKSTQITISKQTKKLSPIKIDESSVEDSYTEDFEKESIKPRTTDDSSIETVSKSSKTESSAKENQSLIKDAKKQVHFDVYQTKYEIPSDNTLQPRSIQTTHQEVQTETPPKMQSPKAIINIIENSDLRLETHTFDTKNNKEISTQYSSSEIITAKFKSSKPNLQDSSTQFSPSISSNAELDDAVIKIQINTNDNSTQYSPPLQELKPKDNIIKLTKHTQYHSPERNLKLKSPRKEQKQMSTQYSPPVQEPVQNLNETLTKHTQYYISPERNSPKRVKSPKKNLKETSTQYSPKLQEKTPKNSPKLRRKKQIQNTGIQCVIQSPKHNLNQVNSPRKIQNTGTQCVIQSPKHNLNQVNSPRKIQEPPPVEPKPTTSDYNPVKEKKKLYTKFKKTSTPLESETTSSEFDTRTGVSPGEVLPCSCSISIGEIHLCRYANNIRKNEKIYKENAKKMFKQSVEESSGEIVYQRKHYDNWHSYYITSSEQNTSSLISSIRNHSSETDNN